MGGSESVSKAELVSNTAVLNQSTLNVLNQVSNKTAVDTMIENAKKCSASIAQTQTQEYGDITVSGGSKATLSQEQAAKLDFTCLQQDKVQNDVIQKMADTLNQAFTENTSTDLMNKLDSAIKQKTAADTTGFPWGGAKTSSDVKQKINVSVKNITANNIKSVVENSVSASFKNSNIQECIAVIVQNQKIKAGNLTVTDKSEFAASQLQNADLLAKCIQTADIATKVVSDVAAYAGLSMEIKKDTKSIAESAVKTEQETVQKGILGGVAGIVDSIGGLLGNVFTGLGMGLLAPLASPSLVSCCCLCCLLVLFIIFGGMSSMGSGTSTSTYETAQ